MRSILLIGMIASASVAGAQIIDNGIEEEKLYAQTKQVNQFFRRFNGEEDLKGNRYYPGHKDYRSVSLRRKYISILFDDANDALRGEMKTQFIKDVLDRPEPLVLDFHAGQWFAEVHTLFNVRGREREVTLYMELEKSHQGTKWVITKAHIDSFDEYFAHDTSRVGRFIHPMSHELDFMNLRKAFKSDSLSQFAVRTFKPDHLSVLLYEAKNGNMKFNTITNVRFHFFQIDGWYFELSEFNRPGYNTGWLVSNLVRLRNEGEKNLLMRYIRHET